MSFWSGEKLLEIKSVVETFDPSCLDANAYNLSVGNCYFVTSDDTKQTMVKLRDEEPFVIPPGQFAYLMTNESLKIPANAMAFISMRTGTKFQGLINVSGFHVDPGYRGQLIYAVYNASPSSIHLREGEKLFKIWFADLDRKSANKHIFSESGKTEISGELMHGMSKEIYSNQTLAEKIRDIESELKRNSFANKLIMGFIVAIFSIIVTSGFFILRPAFETWGKRLDQWVNEQQDSQRVQSSADIDTDNSEEIPDKSH